MKLAAKKLAAVMLMAAMVGTIPGVDVFAESVQGTSSVPDDISAHKPRPDRSRAGFVRPPEDAFF